jgi:DNA primase
LGFLTRQRADLAAARQASLIRDGERGPRDYFVDRVTFPIRDVEGRVIAFGARALRADQEPKYLNSPESPVFVKGRIWYGLDAARTAIHQERVAIAVEGYMDVIALHQAGIRHAVANLGTAVTERHVEILRRYADAVVLAYDGDAAGQNATLRAGAIFEAADFPVRVAALPAGEDPDTLVRLRGPAVVRALIGAAEPLLDFRLKQIRGRYNLKDPEQRLAMVTEAARAIAASRSHVTRAEYVGKLNAMVNDLPAFASADRQQEELAALLGEIRRVALGSEAARARRQAPSRPNAGRTGGGAAGARHPEPGAAAARGQRGAEQYVLRAALSDPGAWAGLVADRLRPDLFTAPDCRRIADAFLGNNRGEAIAAAEAVARDPELAEEISKILVVDEGAVEERVLAECLERIERHPLRLRFEQLKGEIAQGTLPRSDQRYAEFLRLQVELGNAPLKGDG